MAEGRVFYGVSGQITSRKLHDKQIKQVKVSDSTATNPFRLSEGGGQIRRERIWQACLNRLTEGRIARSAVVASIALTFTGNYPITKAVIVASADKANF